MRTDELEVAAPELVRLQDAVTAALDARDQTMAAIEFGIKKIVDAGALLSVFRDRIPDGDWIAWQEANIVQFTQDRISRQTVAKWIRLAKFDQLYPGKLDDAVSVRNAYQLAGILPEAESGGSSQKGNGGGGYLAELAKTVSHLNAQLAQRPLEQWSPSDRQVLKSRIEPLVAIYEKLN